MKIVIKKINGSDIHDYIVYLKTDDNISVSADFATSDNLDYVIDDLRDDDESIKIFMEDNKEVKKTNNEYPIVLVFYLNRELMGNGEIIQPFVDAVNQSIAEREANMMAFFLPTDEQEKVECINPLLATTEEKSRITKLIDDISMNFDIGQGADDNTNINED